jgi:hypothetical protein
MKKKRKTERYTLFVENCVCAFVLIFFFWALAFQDTSDALKVTAQLYKLPEAEWVSWAVFVIIAMEVTLTEHVVQWRFQRLYYTVGVACYLILLCVFQVFESYAFLPLLMYFIRLILPYRFVHKLVKRH